MEESKDFQLLHSPQDQVSSVQQCVELKFSVPWGHIAGKRWGDPCGQPVLCIHGIQDNAGTFDHLIPLLPPIYHYVAIDLPGHGASSHYPDGIPLDFSDYVLCLVRVLNHLQWETCYYIGHSLGGQLGVYLCSLWPHRVKKLVMLDALAPMFTETPFYLKRNKLLLDNILTSEERFSGSKGPNYTYKEALGRIVSNRNSKLSLEAAKTLLKRSLVENGDGGYSFTTDQRLKKGLWSILTPNQQAQILNNVKCPVLAILTLIPKLKMWKVVPPTLELFAKKENFERLDIKGNHDVHLNNPESVFSSYN